MFDPYHVLGVTTSATDEEVKRAFKKKTIKYHPDKHKDMRKKELNEEKFKKVQQAYEEIMKERDYKNNMRMSTFVNPILDTYFDDIFSKMDNRMKFMKLDEIINDNQKGRGVFYSKSMYTCTRNGKTVTKIEENVNGDKKVYESYDSHGLTKQIKK